MFIYADESGNTGKNIFDEPRLFHLGALLLKDEKASECIKATINTHKSRLGIPRLHAKKLSEKENLIIGQDLLKQLSSHDYWFHVTRIEKPYIAICKFVDTVFDSFDNPAVPSHWYKNDFLRHSLCLLFTQVFYDKLIYDFWTCCLAGDTLGFKELLKTLKEELLKTRADKRLKEVAEKGLEFAREHTDNFTLRNSEKRSAYKVNTPNAIAFTGLINAVQRYSEKYNVRPAKFFHDEQKEFKDTMKDLHDYFATVSLKAIHTGWFNVPVRNESGLGQFFMPSSGEMEELQAVDMLLWLYQKGSAQTKAIFKTVQDTKMDEFEISSPMSSLIVYAGQKKFSQTRLTAEQVANGRKMLAEIDAFQKKGYKEFLAKKTNPA